MAEVYWIHLPEHTDMFSQGYIGITSKTTQVRWKEHQRSVSNTHKKSHLIAAIKSYGVDNMIVETLVVANRDYCLWLEHKLRPAEQIGWNIAVGGRAPMAGQHVSQEIKDKRANSYRKTFEDPVVKERHSEMLKKRYAENPDIKERVVKSLTSLWENPSHREHLSSLQKEKYKDPEYKLRMRQFIPEGSISEGMSPWGNGTSDTARWLLAEYYYDSWCLNGRCGTKAMARIHNKTNKSYFATLVKKFREGWVPKDDQKYMNWKQATIGGTDVT